MFTPLKRDAIELEKALQMTARKIQGFRQKKGDYMGTSLRYTQILKEVGMTDHTKVECVSNTTGTDTSLSYEIRELRQIFNFIHYNSSYVEHPVRNTSLYNSKKKSSIFL